MSTLETLRDWAVEMRDYAKSQENPIVVTNDWLEGIQWAYQRVINRIDELMKEPQEPTK